MISFYKLGADNSYSSPKLAATEEEDKNEGMW